MPRSTVSISCPFCKTSRTHVTHVSHHEEQRGDHLLTVTRRRRRCEYCGMVFKTVEAPVVEGASDASPSSGGFSAE